MPTEKTPRRGKAVISKVVSCLVTVAGFALIAAIAGLVGALPGSIVGALAGALAHATAYGAKLGALIGAVPCVLRLAYWYWHGWKLKTPGYIAPEPSRLEQWLYKGLCRVLLRTAVGPIKVIGLENAQFNGRLIVTPNHTHGLDFMAVTAGMPFAFRTVAASSQILGLASGLSAFAGIFGVPTVAGKSVGNTNAVIDGSANMLAQHRLARQMMFPQGLLHFDNVLKSEEFRTGAVRIMQEVAERTPGEPIAILPVALHYWPTWNNPWWVRRLFIKLWVKTQYSGAPLYGVTVVIGKPITLDQLSQDPREATEQLCAVIQTLLDTAKAQS